MQFQNINLLKPSKLKKIDTEPIKTGLSTIRILTVPDNDTTEDPGTTIVQIEERFTDRLMIW